MTLLVLSLAYLLFTLPLLPVKLGVLGAYQSMILYAFYWWMYAVNFFIYVTTSKNLRRVYKVFLGDVYEATSSSVRLFVSGCKRTKIGKSGTFEKTSQELPSTVTAQFQSYINI